MNILLVDDDREEYIITRKILGNVSGVSFELDWVGQWDDALKAIEAGKYDAYLIDYYLGELSGLDLIRATAEQPKPLILLTGNDSRETDLEAMAAGASDYLVKGQITPALLDRSIRYAIERKVVEKRLATMACHDTLTGLTNRFLFYDRLTDLVANNKRADNELCGVLLLDLDRFKDVNDTLGHLTGDSLLVEVGKRLIECIRETDTVARLGGDEFAIIARHLQQANGAAVLASKIQEALAAPFFVDDHTVHTSASFGITLFPSDARDAEQLLKYADIALYKAKHEERGGFRYFNDKMYAEAQAQKSLEQDMRLALKRDEFVLNYQPKIDGQDGSVTGAEALVRWQHPKKGLIMPDQFIPVAEATGMIVPLGNIVLMQACRQSVAWRAAGMPIPVAVNLSVMQVKRSEIVAIVENTIQETGIDPGDLELEITESVMIDNLSNVLDSLHKLHDMGVRLTIDDFGTGHSSLSYLRQLPVDTIKIDRSFVRDITEDECNADLANAIVHMAKTLNIRTIAEGVETESQRISLCRSGCDELQGYLISKPVAVDSFNNWYRANGGAASSALKDSSD